MMKHFFTILAFLFIPISFCYAQQQLKLRYEEPADTTSKYKIEESLPLGNGHLGAMPDGGIFNEMIILNDITMWSGSKQNGNRPGAASHLRQIRNTIFEGKYSQAENLVNQYFVCEGEGTGLGDAADAPYGSYQVLGNMHIQYDYNEPKSQIEPQNYVRSLSLDSAIAVTTYKLGGVTYHREYFTSFSDDVIMIKVTADQPGEINFDLTIDRPERYQTQVVGHELQMFGQLNDGYDGKDGVKYLTRIKVKNIGGTLTAGRNNLKVEDANSAIIYISSTTDFLEKKTTSFYQPSFHYKQYSEDNLKNAMNKSYEEEKKKHIQAYQKLFHRARLSLGKGNAKHAKLPTKDRLIKYENDKTDTELPVLYFQFGRYLLISSTRPGWLPPNLQGLWANKVHTSWNGDYHDNINIQMNHWPVEQTNLSMLNEPFYKLVKGLVKPGEKTAKVYYDVDKGWVCHAITNAWGFTAPGEQASWGSSNSGSGWLANLLWRNYAFTLDRDYLKKIYPIIKGSAQFYLNALVEYPNNDSNWLVTAPSSSPENSFKYKASDGTMKTAAVCAGPTIDNQIIRELFTHVIEATKTLQVDSELSALLDAVRKRLPPNQIDDNGRLMEWLHPFALTNPHHRHMSPVWGLYPGTEISFENDSVIANAAEKLIIQRGYASSFGWSDGWKMNLWARLGKGNRAFSYLNYILKPAAQGGHAFPNFFDSYGGHHSPFQIDANFGATAGIAEMLIQSQSGKIKLLPALPDEWNTGSYEGLSVRGGGEMSATWSNGELKTATLKAKRENTFKIIIPDHLKLQPPDTTNSYQVKNNILTVSMEKGDHIHLIFKEK